jgi:hypothetical protein
MPIANSFSMAELALSIVASVLVALVVWIVQSVKGDIRASRDELRDHIHALRGDMQQSMTKIAVLEERIRVFSEFIEGRTITRPTRE